MRFAKWIGAAVLVLILGGALVFFGNFYAKNPVQVEDSSHSNSTITKTTTGSSKKGVQVTGKATDDQYKTVIKDGTYLVSKARGMTASQNNDNVFNMVSFETGLLDFSKQHFSPKSYIFQEGQYLTMATAENWLNRKSEKNPDGINPEDNGKTDDSRVPIYLQSIEEQDFMTQDGNDLKLGGIVIGMAMNTTDYYQKEQYGATYSQTISKDDMIAHGKTMAEEVIKRYRQMKGIDQNIPIVVAMYAQAANDSLSGGSYYAWSEAKSGDSLGAWQNLNYESVVLPMQEGNDNSKSVADELNKSFVNFQNNIQNFFPNLSSVTAQAQYNGPNLLGMNVTVTTQFYSATEIDSFANYISQVAPNYLPSNVPVQIRLTASTGMQSVIIKKQNEKVYTVVNMGSY
ncbi:MAG: CamS family sex pheromone protein [Lactobacillaceae bacterium]|jgi:protein involved in sex pheromone biosynthesis|nr:CamS family sex pheromone protein [Lactobacillaceae bacterium]